MVIEYLPILEQKDNKILTIGKIDRTKAHTNPPVLHATSIIVAVLPDGKIILTDKTEKQIKNEISTIRLIYPQWQGGDVSSLLPDFSEEESSTGYYIGAYLLNFLAPKTNQKILKYLL